MRRRSGLLPIAFPVGLLLAGIFACSRTQEGRARESSSAVDAVRITQFYVTEPKLPKGEKTKLCYGVENANSVRLSPAVETLWPSLSRCFEIAPVQNTTYSLTATDARGRTVSQQTAVEITPPHPKIDYVSVSALTVKRGQKVIICYRVKNADSVAASPGKFITTRSPEHACLVDFPAKSTTYTVTAHGAGGVDTERVQVKVQ